MQQAAPPNAAFADATSFTGNPSVFGAPFHHTRNALRNASSFSVAFLQSHGKNPRTPIAMTFPHALHVRRGSSLMR